VSTRHLTREELEAGLETICRSPKDEGVVELIVRRPRPSVREILDLAQLDPAEGLIGDSWRTRVASPDPETQLNVMNARVIALIAQDTARWPLAGDQLFVDIDLADENLPPGSRIEIGTAVIQVSAEPHTGCGKFVERYGVDAMKFVNSPVGRRLHLRGINARVVRAGLVRVGDIARKRARSESFLTKNSDTLQGWRAGSTATIF
jgi:MOSC domain-containing protein YiiM